MNYFDWIFLTLIDWLNNDTCKFFLFFLKIDILLRLPDDKFWCIFSGNGGLIDWLNNDTCKFFLFF